MKRLSEKFELRGREVAGVLGTGPIGKIMGMTFTGISTDTREIGKGELFVALKGEKYDAHAFAWKAVEAGASGLVVERGRKVDSRGAVLFEVDDTLKAYGDLANYWKRKMNVTTVAITGSMGKTTTREMLAGIAGRKMKVLETEGNLNNLVGLPRTLLKLRAAHDAAIVELGANHFGEIARLTEICEPTIGAITNVGDAHLEFFKTRAGVARAKTELFEKMLAGGCAVLNRDEKLIASAAAGRRLRKVTFGRKKADVVLKDYRPGRGWRSDLVMQVRGETIRTGIRATGEHNAMNALCAAACAVAMGIGASDIAKGLELFRPIHGRGVLEKAKSGATIIDDTYNANPSAVEMSMRALVERKGPGRAMAALGEMFELGRMSAELHRKTGMAAARIGVDEVLACGIHAQDVVSGAKAFRGWRGRAASFTDLEEMAGRILANSTKRDVILVKGSRASGMDRLVKILREGPDVP